MGSGRCDISWVTHPNRKKFWWRTLTDQYNLRKIPNHRFDVDLQQLRMIRDFLVIIPQKDARFTGRRILTGRTWLAAGRSYIG